MVAMDLPAEDGETITVTAFRPRNPWPIECVAGGRITRLVLTRRGWPIAWVDLTAPARVSLGRQSAGDGLPGPPTADPSDRMVWAAASGRLRLHHRVSSHDGGDERLAATDGSALGCRGDDEPEELARKDNKEAAGTGRSAVRREAQRWWFVCSWAWLS